MTVPTPNLINGCAIAGAVLTGGASRRMGRDKALLEVAGVVMARRVADVIRARGCGPVVAIGGDAAGLAAVGLVSITDRWPGEGPLGGILTALEWASVDSPTCVLVVATDLPWLDAATVGALIAHLGRTDVDVVAARSDRLEPLCALWWPSAVATLAGRFAGGERAVHRAITALRCHEVTVAPRALTNVNTPGDLD